MYLYKIFAEVRFTEEFCSTQVTFDIFKSGDEGVSYKDVVRTVKRMAEEQDGRTVLDYDEIRIEKLII